MPIVRLAVKLTTCHECRLPISKGSWRITERIGAKGGKLFTIHFHTHDPRIMPEEMSCYMEYMKKQAVRAIDKQEDYIKSRQKVAQEREAARKTLRDELSPEQMQERQAVLMKISAHVRYYEGGKNPVRWYHPLVPQEYREEDWNNNKRLKKYCGHIVELAAQLRGLGGIPVSRLPLAKRAGLELTPKEELALSKPEEANEM